MVLPKIRMSRMVATEIIKDQLKRGREISDMEDSFFSDINDAISEERIWSDFNRSFAEKAFGENYAKDYEECVPHPIPSGGLLVSDKEAALSHRLKAKILWLRSTLKQIP